MLVILSTLEREKRALCQVEKELGFSGRIIDYTSYTARG
jgi:hypothetical protein